MEPDRASGEIFLDGETIKRALAVLEWHVTASFWSSLCFLRSSTKVLSLFSFIFSSLFLPSSETSLLAECWIFTGTPVGVRNRPPLPANAWEMKGLEMRGLASSARRMFLCSSLSCRSSVRMHKGDLLTPEIGLPIRFRWPRTWLDRPVLVSNHPRHRGQVCSVWDSGLSIVAKKKKKKKATCITYENVDAQLNIENKCVGCLDTPLHTEFSYYAVQFILYSITKVIIWL